MPFSGGATVLSQPLKFRTSERNLFLVKTLIIASTAATGIIHGGGSRAQSRFSSQAMAAPIPAPPEMASHWTPGPWNVYSPRISPPIPARMSPTTSDATSRKTGTMWLWASSHRAMGGERRARGRGGGGASGLCRLGKYDGLDRSGSRPDRGHRGHGAGQDGGPGRAPGRHGPVSRHGIAVRRSLRSGGPYRPASPSPSPLSRPRWAPPTPGTEPPPSSAR